MDFDKSLPTVFVGYDEREHPAYQICVHTLRKNSSIPINVIPLKHKELRDMGLFRRAWAIDASTGRYRDCEDGNNFSTQFSFSRFLVPALHKQLGLEHPVAIFVDCDFLFLGDVAELFELGTYRGLSCVKHDFKSRGKLKMDGCRQYDYDFKLWSALMVFNMDYPEISGLSPDIVNTASGNYLHTFKWIDETSVEQIDKYIGKIPEGWNFIPRHSEKNTNEIKSIHYTEGVPHMAGYEFCPYADLYWKEYKEVLQCELLITDKMIKEAEFALRVSQK